MCMCVSVWYKPHQRVKHTAAASKVMHIAHCEAMPVQCGVNGCSYGSENADRKEY